MMPIPRKSEITIQRTCNFATSRQNGSSYSLRSDIHNSTGSVVPLWRIIRIDRKAMRINFPPPTTTIPLPFKNRFDGNGGSCCITLRWMTCICAISYGLTSNAFRNLWDWFSFEVSSGLVTLSILGTGSSARKVESKLSASSIRSWI